MGVSVGDCPADGLSPLWMATFPRQGPELYESEGSWLSINSSDQRSVYSLSVPGCGCDVTTFRSCFDFPQTVVMT